MTSSFDTGVERNALLSLSASPDGDDVSPGEGWSMCWSMRLSRDPMNSTFMSRTHPLELEAREKNCAQGGVSSFAEDLRAASPVSPGFFSQLATYSDGVTSA